MRQEEAEIDVDFERIYQGFAEGLLSSHLFSFFDFDCVGPYELLLAAHPSTRPTSLPPRDLEKM